MSDPNCRVVVVGPTRSKGGITSVISAHSKMPLWRTFACESLNTFDDGGMLKKFVAAVSSYVRAPFLFMGCKIVHFHIAGPTSIARKLPLLFLARLMNKSVILHLHAPNISWLLCKRPKRLFGLACYLADRLIVLSPWWSQHLKDGGVKTAIEIVPNSIGFFPEPRTSGNIQGRPSVLFVGKLEQRKGYSDLIRAALQVLQSVPETEFIFVGHGAISEAWDLATSLGIADSTRLMGWLGSDALAKLYRAATVFCLPSYGEGLPMSVLEAMSWGVPIVTTPVGGIPDLVTNNVNGILVEPGDIAGLASSITALLQASEGERGRFGMAAREAVLRICDPKVVSAKLAEVYDDLLSSPPLHSR